jgi:moderate conductance mechanosensitive channel
MRLALSRLVPFALALIIAMPSSLMGQPAPPTDLHARVAQLRALLASDQGAAILDLLGDPQVRQAVLGDVDAIAPNRAGVATAGEMMETMLTGIRSRLRGLASELTRVPDELAETWARLRSQLPGSALFRLFGFLVVFLAGGMGAQFLFFRVARPWRAHFDTLALATPRQRAAVVCERLLFATLIIAAFATGSMGAFLLFAWPPLTGSIILGYLLAFLLTRLGLSGVRFFLAPNAERLRLVNVSTETAWFWHRWIARLVGTAALGWQTLLTLGALGMPEPGLDVLLQLLLLLLTCFGIRIVWTVPAADNSADQPNRGPLARLLISLGLILDWLFFLMGARALGWTLLILAAAPAANFILGRSAAVVMRGRWAEPGDERSAHVAIAERAIQAIVVVLAATALVRVWHIDVTRMSTMDTPMTRIARGLLEALVILVIADLLWQVVRVLIDARLTGDALSIDNLAEDELRRQARLRTLLPVLRNFAFFIVLVMASLSALAAIGLQIGPLLAGAGVVGIAVGFGAQTLVRDIISGVFFLLDDAFRVGENIESGGIRGTVVVTYDTDLDLLDRTVEAVSNDLMADPAMASEMIEPLRSLGVQAMIDTGMQISLTFKTRPGHQFAVRRVVFGRIRAAFVAAGIRFASTAVVQSSAAAEPVPSI